MGQIPVTVTDFADTRTFQCRLPDDVQVSSLTARMAEVAHLPTVGPDGSSLNYGFVAKGGTLLDSYASLADHDLPDPLVLRLVPEFTVGGSDVECSSIGVAERIVIADAVTAAGGEHRTGTLPFPPRDLDLGPRPDVRIDARVHRQIESFATIDPHVECAGLLLGSVGVEDKETVVHITAAVPAVGAVGTRATVKVTLDAWEYMLTVRDRDYPDLQVMGWFHTHAGWGVFMSDADVFAHRSFFSHPAMVAYVLDSLSGRDGFFYWHEGEITLCSSYGLVGERAEQIDEPKARRKWGRPDLRDLAITVLAGAVLYLGLAKTAPVDHRAVSAAKPPSVARVKLAPRLAKTEQTEITGYARLAPQVRTSPSARAMNNRSRTYTISSGETLGVIAKRIYGDSSLGPALAKCNGIEDETGVQIGQEIRTPSKAVLERMR